MNKKPYITIIIALLTITSLSSFSQNGTRKISFDFYGDSIEFPIDSSILIPFTSGLTEGGIEYFYQQAEKSHYVPIINALIRYKEEYNPDDWLYYQLVRKVAQLISPKAENYNRYTLFKWFFLVKSGYDARLTISGNKMLFYVQCDEKIYNIPSRIS